MKKETENQKPEATKGANVAEAQSGQTKVVNLTKAEVRILDENDEVIVAYPASGELAEVSTEAQALEPLPNGTPLFATVFGKTSGIPAEKEGVIYIVSTFVLSANRHRTDLFAPYKLKFAEGKPIGCKGLTR